MVCQAAADFLRALKEKVIELDVKEDACMILEP